MKKKVLAGFAVLLVILLSSFLTGCCNLFAFGAVKLESLPTAPGVEGKSILYSDDFSKPNSNWDTGSWNNGGADYYNGGFRINVPSENNIFAYLHQSFQKDVIVEVDVTDISEESFGSKGDVYAGIRVRHTSDDSKYDFTISVNQNYGSGGISIVHQNISNPIGTTIKNWKLPPNWDRTFHIRADAIGDQLSLYVNGYLVYSVKDSEISSGGEIGFFGGRAGAKQYLFDNLVVYAADEKAATTKQATTNAEETTDWGEAVTTESSDEAKEAPTISLAIYEGPIIEENICYYRVEATVTGSPNPAVSFSKDDGGGAWGSNKVQINLNYPGDTYTLEATATNSEGSAKDSITLSW